MPSPDLTTCLSFFGAALLLALAPGPDNLFVLTQAALSGWRSGFYVTLGLCTGLLVHTSAVALGIAALIVGSPLAFSLLRVVGALYLLFLAWGAWRAPQSHPASTTALKTPGRALYLRGIVMNLSNPKVLLFFLAFLPQFTQPERGSIPLQVLVLGCLFLLAALLVFGSIALGASWIGSRLQRFPGAQVWLHRCAALLFIGLAFRLLLP